MKTFAFDSLQRYSRFCEFRNIKKLVCNKPWMAFSEDASSETYTFLPNGTLLVDVNGTQLKSTWQFAPKTKTLTFSGHTQSHNFALIFIDKAIMALQLDGDTNFAFLINGSNDLFFKPQKYIDIIAYFRHFEEEEDKEIELSTANPQKTPVNQSPEFQAKLQQAEEKKRLESQADDIYFKINRSSKATGRIFTVLLCLATYLTIAANYYLSNVSIGESILNALTYGTLINILICALRPNKLVARLANKQNIKRWKQQHPTDPRNKYL